jgi:hypothetical protein
MDKPKLSRRNFLLAGVATGAAGVAAVAVQLSPATKGTATADKAQDGKGYQLSEHVRNYYRTTQV